MSTPKQARPSKRKTASSEPDPVAELVRKADRDPLVRAALLQAIMRQQARAKQRGH